MLAIIERWKDRGLTPERVSAGEAGDFARGRGVELYKAYQERLRRLNACDFGDLLLHNLTPFQTQSESGRASWRERVWQSVECSRGAVSLKKKKNNKTNK